MAPRASTAVCCPECNKTIGRRADLPRHMKTHATNKEEFMHDCPQLGCTYKTLQRSNLATHLNVHTRKRPNKCPEDGCDFNTSDPGSLTRHRKEIHGYEPKANFGNHPTAVTHKAARQRRKISPYTIPSSSTSSSSSVRSVSPLDPPSGIHSPRPRVPRLSPSSFSPADACGKNGIKNTSAAYSTELITKLPGVNDSGPAPNPKPENSLLLTSELSTTLEAPTMEYPQLPVPEQGNFHAVDPPAQPVSGETAPIEVSDAMLDDFLAQFNNWDHKATPPYTAPSLPAPLVCYTADDVHAPILASFLSCKVQYPVDNAIIPTPASIPSYGLQYTASNITVPTPASVPWYGVDNAVHGYPINAASFDPQFSQPRAFIAPNMGFYPQAINQTYFYTAPASTSGFSNYLY